MKKDSNYTIDLIKYDWYGILGLGMAPGKNYLWSIQKRNLHDDLQKIRNFYKMDLIVNLLQPQEMGFLGIDHYRQQCDNICLKVEFYPIGDMDFPGDAPKFKNLVKKIVQEYLNKGKRVLVHCQSGNGRTGLFVAACYIYGGSGSQQAIQKVRKIRKYANQSHLQQNFLRNLKFDQ